MALARNLSDNANTILNLEFRLLIETDPAKKAQLQEMMGRLVERKKELEGEAETSSREFLSIVSGPIGQLQQTPNTPSTPPGLTRPAVNLRRSSATIADNNEPEAVKKCRIEDSVTLEENEVLKIVEVEQMVTDAGPHEPVCPINHFTSNTLIATYDDIPVSMMTNKTPVTRPKSMFRGVLDKLRDLSQYRRSRTISCRSPPANLCPKSFLIIALLVIAMSVLQTAQAFHAPTSTFSIYALNANGLVQPVKLNHINSVINAMKPQAFVIGETKTRANLGESLPFSDYDIYEEAGECAENHHIFKWGIVIGIRKDIQVAQ